jgi:hypothetical protein
MSDLACILRSYGLEHCEARLTSLGVYDFNHISYLTEWDVLKTGITLIDVRLLAISLAELELNSSNSAECGHKHDVRAELTSHGAESGHKHDVRAELTSPTERGGSH